MPARILIFTLLIFLGSAYAVPSFEQMKREQRVALVVANGDYENRPLSQASKSGAKVRAFLEASGFKVIYHEDIDRRAFAKALRTFSGAIRPNGVALFYYFGHGTSQNRKNYLIPLEHTIYDASHIRQRSIALDSIIKSMQKRQARLNIVILDTAYSDPFGDDFKSETPGLASIAPKKGFDFFLSLFPGRTAKQQSFTSHFIDAFADRGVTLEAGKAALFERRPEDLKPMILIDDTQPFFFRMPPAP
ncbi:MAG: caspase family protein [Sulfurimonadaceae bacterium]|nr:caspase family protein [Sulfurimonadaceae bacterium]